MIIVFVISQLTSISFSLRLSSLPDKYSRFTRNKFISLTHVPMSPSSSSSSFAAVATLIF